MPVVKETAIEKKKRLLRALLAGYGRGAKADLGRYVRKGQKTIWNWCAPDGPWPLYRDEPLLWAFFGKKLEGDTLTDIEVERGFDPFQEEVAALRGDLPVQPPRRQRHVESDDALHRALAQVVTQILQQQSDARTGKIPVAALGRLIETLEVFSRSLPDLISQVEDAMRLLEGKRPLPAAKTKRTGPRSRP